MRPGRRSNGLRPKIAGRRGHGVRSTNRVPHSGPGRGARRRGHGAARPTEAAGVAGDAPPRPGRGRVAGSARGRPLGKRSAGIGGRVASGLRPQAAPRAGAGANRDLGIGLPRLARRRRARPRELRTGSWNVGAGHSRPETRRRLRAACARPWRSGAGRRWPTCREMRRRRPRRSASRSSGSQPSSSGTMPSSPAAGTTP